MSTTLELGWHLQGPGDAASVPFQLNRRFFTSTLVAEALAVKATLITASNLGVQHIKVFSDSKILISLLNISKCSRTQSAEPPSL